MKVKNRAPAPIQITAEQILLEAQERQVSDYDGPPLQKITDQEELDMYVPLPCFKPLVSPASAHPSRLCNVGHSRVNAWHVQVSVATPQGV